MLEVMSSYDGHEALAQTSSADSDIKNNSIAVLEDTFDTLNVSDITVQTETETQEMVKEIVKEQVFLQTTNFFSEDLFNEVVSKLLHKILEKGYSPDAAVIELI